MSIDGTSLTQDYLSDITVTRAIGNKALYGVATAGISFRALTSIQPPEGAAVIFTDSTCGTTHPTYYATDITRDGDVLNITAYDTCKNLDVPFDHSGYQQFDGQGTTSEHLRKYPTSLVLGDLANQCGFSHSSPSISSVPELYYKDLAGKTCKQILEELAKAECGFWKCANDNTLVFVAYSKVPDTVTIPEASRTAINAGQSKSIGGVHAVDTCYNEVTVETSVSWRQTEILEGRFLSSTVAPVTVGKIIPSTYTGFSVTAIDRQVNIGTQAIAGGGRVMSSVYKYSDHLIADYSAPAPDTSFAPYQNIYQRMIEDRVTQGKTMGTVFISETGSGYRLKM